MEWSGVLTGVVVAVRSLTVCRVILYIPGCMARYFLPAAAAAAAALGYIHCMPLGAGGDLHDCVTVRSMVNIARLTIWSIYCSLGCYEMVQSKHDGDDDGGGVDA